jgi:hypothetical protein
MLAKRHRQNHDFTIIHHLAGSCHTADAAYALLMDLREDRQSAVEAFEVQQLRDLAKECRAKERLGSSSAADQLEGKADLLELENNRRAGQVLLSAAQDEIATIDKAIAALRPKRKFAHLSDAEAVEAIQSEEWAEEMRFRAENHLLTTGTIPPDEFASMRQHPSFAAEVLPRITELQTMIESGQREKLLSQICSSSRLLGPDKPDVG